MYQLGWHAPPLPPVGMVHPSTGYMVSRVLGAAPTVADAIVDQLCSVRDKAVDAHLPAVPRSDAEQAAMAAAVWAAMWPVQRIRQREFFEFGMEVGGVVAGLGGR